jgi:CrcB protein
VGALARWVVGEAIPAAPGEVPWATLAINVVGSFALALLPAFAGVRRRPVLVAGLGPGVLGGFTTLSACSDQARALLASGHVGTAGGYLAGTLGACLLAVLLADRWSTQAARDEVAAEGGDE